MKNNLTVVNPLNRWKVAHHLFFVLIEGLILAHRDLLEALEQNDVEKAMASFNLASQLFWGSTGAFRFGTDYTAEDYESVVRPSMGPPTYTPGFSDLQSIDHTALLNLISKLTPYFKNLSELLKPAYQGYLSALNTVYENHAYVCERFVGEKGGSLLQKKQLSEKVQNESASESIRKIYKKRTLKYAGVE